MLSENIHTLAPRTARDSLHNRITMFPSTFFANVDSFNKALRSFGPIVWNTMLPEELKTCQSLDEFKNSIKTWVPENCPCELCKTYIVGLGYTVVCE